MAGVRQSLYPIIAGFASVLANTPHSHFPANDDNYSNQAILTESELRELALAQKNFTAQDIIEEAKQIAKRESYYYEFAYDAEVEQARKKWFVEYLKNDIKRQEKLPTNIKESFETRLAHLKKESTRLNSIKTPHKTVVIDGYIIEVASIHSGSLGTERYANTVNFEKNFLEQFSDLNEQELDAEFKRLEKIYTEEAKSKKYFSYSANAKKSYLISSLYRETRDESEIIRLKALVDAEEERLSNPQSEIPGLRKRQSSYTQTFSFDRAHYNLSKDAEILLHYFPSIEKRIANGKFNKKDVLDEIETLKKKIKGGYVGKDPKQKFISDSDIKSNFDESSKFLIAAAWIASRPDAKFAFSQKDDHKIFPKEIFQYTGSLNEKTRGYNNYYHTAINNFDSAKDITTVVHEFIHQRDRAKSLPSWLSSSPYLSSATNGKMPKSNLIDDLASNRKSFKEKLENDPGLRSELFDLDPSSNHIVSKDTETTAYTDAAFLTDTIAAGGIKEIHPALYDDLVEYYGFDPVQ